MTDSTTPELPPTDPLFLTRRYLTDTLECGTVSETVVARTALKLLDTALQSIAADRAAREGAISDEARDAARETE